MPPEVGQEAVPLFLSRAAALAAIEPDQHVIARPLEITKISSPGTAWPTEQNGNLPKYLKGILHAATSSEFLQWLAATQSILCADCGKHCYPNCLTPPKKFKDVVRCKRKGYRPPASPLADPQNQTRFTLATSDRLFVIHMYQPIFEKVRRKRRYKRKQPLFSVALENPIPALPRKRRGRPRKQSISAGAALEPAA